MKTKRAKRIARHNRARKKIEGTESMPRLTIFRSNKFIYAQLIDDGKRMTLLHASDVKNTQSSKIDKAKEVGKNLAGLAIKKNIKKVVFDRGGYRYHGRVKALAEGAREGGLVF